MWWEWGVQHLSQAASPYWPDGKSLCGRDLRPLLGPPTSTTTQGRPNPVRYLQWRGHIADILFFKGSETRWPGDNKGCRTWFTGLLSVEEGGALLKKKITIINAFRSVIGKLPNLWWNICHFSPDNLKILWVIKLSNKIAQILLECQAVFFVSVPCCDYLCIDRYPRLRAKSFAFPLLGDI